MSKSEAKKYYTKKGPSSYNDIVPDFHRARYSGVITAVYCKLLRWKSFMVAKLNCNYSQLDGSLVWPKPIVQAISLAVIDQSVKLFHLECMVYMYYSNRGYYGCRWVKGDWTDDTDQMLLILLGIIENKGKVLKKDFAKRMKKWMEEGFAELGDRGKQICCY